jgi:hypothetical protein
MGTAPEIFVQNSVPEKAKVSQSGTEMAARFQVAEGANGTKTVLFNFI